MDSRTEDFYQLPNIDELADIHLMDLREQCLRLEEQVRRIIEELPESQRYILEAYLDNRDDLEFYTMKAALRWGKKHIR